MKFARIVLFIVALSVVSSVFAQRKKPVYAFGFSASFTDTVVYYTEPMVIDSVHLDKRGFLPYRDHYSYQLKNYLEYEKGEKNRTCMIYFHSNEKKVKKEQAKLLGKYKKDKSIVVQELPTTDFRFTKPEE